MMKKGGAKKETYDVVVIGSGSAGMSAAFSARAAGARVVMIERERLGGECPNWACVPSKALLRAAKAYRKARASGVFGVRVSRVTHDFKDVMRYQEDVVDRVTGGGEYGDRFVNLAAKEGIEVIHGAARFVNPHTVKIGLRRVETKAVVVATGTEPFIPPIEGLAGTPFWGFKDVMTLKRQPKSLLVLGAGPVGCELATFFASFGTTVHLVQNAPVVLHREDAEISALADRALRDVGVKVHVNATVSRIGYGRRKFQLTLEGIPKPLEADRLLVVTGKQPATKGLGLEKLNLDVTKRGYLLVDGSRATTVSHIFAAGDVTGGMQFTHTAHPAGEVAGHNAAMMAQGKKARRKLSLEVVPRVTFTHPEVASVGMTEEQAKEIYKKVLVGRFRVDALGRAVTDHVQLGLVKLVADAKTKKLVGGHIIAERAGEMIHEVALAVKLGAKMDDLAEMIHAFPTYSEAIAAAAANAVIK